MEQEYLQANVEIDSQHPQIQELARDLTQSCYDEQEKARKLFYFVRDQIIYNMYPKDTDHTGYCASAILARGEGWCLQKSILAAALFRAAQIPARLCFAEVINHALGEKAYAAIGTNHFSPHTYVEIALQQQWVPITPIFDAALCQRLQVPTVEFDGIHPAMLSPTDLQGNAYMEYIRKTKGYAKAPWEYIFSEIKRVYGEKASIWFSRDFLEEGCGKI